MVELVTFGRSHFAYAIAGYAPLVSGFPGILLAPLPELLANFRKVPHNRPLWQKRSEVFVVFLGSGTAHSPGDGPLPEEVLRA